MRRIPDEAREQLLRAMDAPMTDLEALQTVVAMFSAISERLPRAPESEQAALFPLVIRSTKVIDHLQERLVLEHNGFPEVGDV